MFSHPKDRRHLCLFRNESRPSMRSSYVIDRNNAQVPSSVAVAASKPPENSSRITAMTSSAAKLRQHPVHETNLDDVMLTAAQNVSYSTHRFFQVSELTKNIHLL